MSGAALERFLARIYSDAGARERFLADPATAAREAGLGPEAEAAVAAIDRVGLELAAESFRRKRARAEPSTGRAGFLTRMARRLRG